MASFGAVPPAALRSAKGLDIDRKDVLQWIRRSAKLAQGFHRSLRHRHRVAVKQLGGEPVLFRRWYA
jgi:hypothetical protein